MGQYVFVWRRFPAFPLSRFPTFSLSRLLAFLLSRFLAFSPSLLLSCCLAYAPSRSCSFLTDTRTRLLVKSPWRGAAFPRRTSGACRTEGRWDARWDGGEQSSHDGCVFMRIEVADTSPPNAAPAGDVASHRRPRQVT